VALGQELHRHVAAQFVFHALEAGAFIGQATVQRACGDMQGVGRALGGGRQRQALGQVAAQALAQALVVLPGEQPVFRRAQQELVQLVLVAADRPLQPFATDVQRWLGRVKEHWAWVQRLIVG
jgi:hypothetical protein